MASTSNVTLTKKHIHHNGRSINPKNVTMGNFFAWLHPQQFTEAEHSKTVECVQNTPNFELFRWYKHIVNPADFTPPEQSMYDFLKTNYAPISVVAENNLTDWVDTGRLGVLDKVLLEAYKEAAVKQRFDIISKFVSRNMVSSEAAWDTDSRTGFETGISHLKRVITRVQECISDIQESGCQVPFALLDFPTENKRQRHY